ncbi:hypothetical protein [Halomonas elongata]|uniref:hypothetical protein n=1 Tax=Halomonas elongata TaxID=2746 RepID=UPI0023AEBF67|nr:hypothetical protein [Halomonas elongata]
MADFERDGWKMIDLTIQHHGKQRKVRALMKKGDDTVTPSFDAPSNLEGMKVSELAEMAWKEKTRLSSS